MNNIFDELAKQLAQSATRRQVRKKNRAKSFILAGIVLAVPGLASAQALVPLIVIPTNQVAASVDSKTTLGSKSSLDDGTLVYADPSKFVYPTVQSAVIIAGPSGPDKGPRAAQRA